MQLHKSKEFMDFLIDNLTLGQQETLMLKFTILKKVDMYVSFGHDKMFAFRMLSNSGIKIGESKFSLSVNTIKKYYYAAKN